MRFCPLQSRKLSARGIGLLGAKLPTMDLLFWKAPTLYLLSATLASGLGAIIGMLSGASSQ